MNYFLVFVLNLFIIVTASSATNINIDLSTFKPENKTTHILEHACFISNKTTQINVINIPSTVGFIVVQVHSFVDNVLVSNNTQYLPKTYVNGTNIGLVQVIEANQYVFSIKSTANNTSVLIVVVAYSSEEPIPGGCNMTFETEIAPYQKITYNEALIRVDSQGASLIGKLCENTTIHLDMYHLYLTEKSLDEEVYFDGIRKMLTVDDVIKHGRKVPEPLGHSVYRRYYSAYGGTGSVFAIVAKYKNKSSAYIPAISFACDISNYKKDCNETVLVYWKFIIASVLFMGIFMCYGGHNFFKTTLFINGFIAGTFITYLVLAFGYDLTLEESTLTSSIFGVIYGMFWILIWWKFGVPLLSVSLSFVLTGMLIASIVFYSGIADINVFQNDINFWVVFASIILSFSMVLTTITLHGHILACAVIGSYAFLAPLCYYSGGNLQYIMINTYRRATVKNFNLAIVDPPFQMEDIAFTITWTVVLLCSSYIQWKVQKGRPPFPPHRFLPQTTRNERTPLLSETPATVYTHMPQ